MIDLRKRDLPDFIKHDGEVYHINTDFRVWIRFDHDIIHNGIANVCVFKDRIPTDAGAFEALREFYESPNVTPSKSSSSTDRAVDMVWDGDYIVASFMQAYGIDLTTIDYMHWHVFKALLYGLPDTTVMAQIMAYRTYTPSKKKHEDIMRDQKRKWRLPTPEEQQERENLLKWAEEAGL